MPERCDFAWPADPAWGTRDHLCDLDDGHEGDHVCGWCIACEHGPATTPNRENGSQ